jgi:hypothetical protein
MHRNVSTLLDAHFLNIKRSLLIVVEMAEKGWVLSEEVCGEEEHDDCCS